MPCPHNQAKLNEINQQISDNNKEKKGHLDNISKCNNIIGKHTDFVTELDCVIKNLSDNTVVAGKEYDEGKMTVCRSEAEETIRDCEAIKRSSNLRIQDLEIINSRLEASKNSYQGDCDACWAAKQAALESSTEKTTD